MKPPSELKKVRQSKPNNTRFLPMALLVCIVAGFGWWLVSGSDDAGEEITQHVGGDEPVDIDWSGEPEDPPEIPPAMSPKKEKSEAPLGSDDDRANVRESHPNRDQPEILPSQETSETNQKPKTPTSPPPPIPTEAKQVEAEPPKPPLRQASHLADGRRLAAEGDHEGASRAFHLAVREDANDAFAWANLGAAEMLLDKRQSALGAYAKALELDPNNWLAHYNLGLYWSRSGDAGRSLDHLEKCLLALEGKSTKRQRQAVLDDLRTHPDFSLLRHERRFLEVLDEQ